MNGDEKCKIGVVWGVRGHPRSSETSPFDRAHMTSYAVYAVVVCLPVCMHSVCVCVCVCVCLSQSGIVSKRLNVE